MFQSLDSSQAHSQLIAKTPLVSNNDNGEERECAAGCVKQRIHTTHALVQQLIHSDKKYANPLGFFLREENQNAYANSLSLALLILILGSLCGLWQWYVTAGQQCHGSLI